MQGEVNLLCSKFYDYLGSKKILGNFISIKDVIYSPTILLFILTAVGFLFPYDPVKDY